MFTINKSVSVWEQLVQLPFLNLYSRLLNAAMELDVFSQLCQPVTAEALAVHMGWHKANTEYLLSALVSIGFLNKTDGTYQNTEEVDRYLVKGKDEYLGGFLPFYMQEGMAPMDVKLLVTKGPQSQQQESVIGYFCGVVLYGDPFTTRVLIGGLIVFGAVLLSVLNWKEIFRRKQA